MSPAQFDAIVQRVADLARQRPRSYRRRLIGLACLGYGYVLAVLLTIVLSGVLLPLLFQKPVNALTVKIEIFLIGFAIVIVRAMWVAIRPEGGLELTRDRVPALFDTVERVRTRMAAPPLYKVLLTSDLNASVQQVPRFGLFGNRNYLLLGLPLLQALSPTQFEAVLAHEFGHLSHRHGRFGAWIYRIRAGWSRLIESMEESGTWLHVIFGRFFAWYAPLFSAYSFVQAREQEHEADRSAAESFGARHLADALVSVRIADGFLEREYWPSVLSQVERSAVPPSAPFTALPSRLTACFTATGASNDLEKALAEKTTSADTHPCLRERLAALGETVTRPEPPTETAVCLLGDQAAELASHFDQGWHGEVAEHWKKRHAAVVQQRERIAALQGTAVETRSVEEWYELCSLVIELDGGDAALPICQEVAARFPDYKQGRYALGVLLLARDDADGLDHLEAGMRDNPAAVVHGWEIAYDFLRRQGRADEAEAFYGRAVQADETMQEVTRERARIDRRTRYQPHDVAPAVLEQIAAAVATRSDIARAYLVRKEVTHMLETPFYVLGVLRRTRWYKWESVNEDDELLAYLIGAIDDLPVQVQCYVVPRGRQLRRIARVADSQLHPPVAESALPRTTVSATALRLSAGNRGRM